MSKPLVIELFAGRFGWSRGFVAEGFQSIGFDIVHEDYHGPVPEGCELVLQDVLTLNGSQFKDATVIVASSPCQAYSYRAMPWKRAKALPPPSNDLFDACFRIQREAIAATGHPCLSCYGLGPRHPGHVCPRCNGTCWITRYIPLIVENVKGAQPWVGRAKWHYGSFYLWGDVPALMPFTKSGVKVSGLNWSGSDKPGYKAQTFNTTAEARMNEGMKVPGFNFHQHEKTGKPGGSFQSAAVDGLKVPGIKLSEVGFNVAAAQRRRQEQGIKQNGSGPEWFDNGIAKHSSRSDSRKAASAAIAEIPYDLANWIARCFKPEPAALFHPQPSSQSPVESVPSR